MSKPDAVYEAFVNTPGYLPMGDEPTSFDSAREAWGWLVDECERGEDVGCTISDAQWTMRRLADSDSAWSLGTPEWMETTLVGTVYAGTPGYDGNHDLGLAYTVVRHDHKLHCGAYPSAIANPSLPCHACELLSMRED